MERWEIDTLNHAISSGNFNAWRNFMDLDPIPPDEWMGVGQNEFACRYTDYATQQDAFDIKTLGRGICNAIYLGAFTETGAYNFMTHYLPRSGIASGWIHMRVLSGLEKALQQIDTEQMKTVAVLVTEEDTTHEQILTGNAELGLTTLYHKLTNINQGTPPYLVSLPNYKQYPILDIQLQYLYNPDGRIHTIQVGNYFHLQGTGHEIAQK